MENENENERQEQIPAGKFYLLISEIQRIIKNG